MTLVSLLQRPQISLKESAGTIVFGMEDGTHRAPAQRSI